MTGDQLIFSQVGRDHAGTYVCVGHTDQARHRDRDMVEEDRLFICPMLNISKCPVSASFDTELTVNIYNQLARERSYYARIPVVAATYTVST